MAEHEGEMELTAPVIGLFGVEALIAKRASLQQRLGKASLELNEASREYNACITDMIALNAALRAEGVDTNALASELQQDLPNETAVNGYGRYDD